MCLYWDKITTSHEERIRELKGQIQRCSPSEKQQRKIYQNTLVLIERERPTFLKLIRGSHYDFLSPKPRVATAAGSVTHVIMRSALLSFRKTGKPLKDLQCWASAEADHDFGAQFIVKVTSSEAESMAAVFEDVVRGRKGLDQLLRTFWEPWSLNPKFAANLFTSSIVDAFSYWMAQSQPSVIREMPRAEIEILEHKTQAQRDEVMKTCCKSLRRTLKPLKAVLT